MKSAVGQVWYWPNTNELLLLLAMHAHDRGMSFDTLDLNTGLVHYETYRSIEHDNRWERWA